MNKQCEECDQFPQKLYCKQCEQKICQDCDLKIHNKSMRAQHVRQSIEKKENQIQNKINIPSTSSSNSQDEISTIDILQQEQNKIQKESQIQEKDSSLQQNCIEKQQKIKKKLKLNPFVEEFNVNSQNQILKTNEKNQISQPSYSDSQLYTHIQNPKQQFTQVYSQNQIQMQSQQQLSSCNSFQFQQTQQQQQQIQNLSIPLLQEFQRMDKQSIIIQTILMQFASSGDLMVLWDTFMECLREELLRQNDNYSIEEIIQNTIDLYHQTMRKFGNTKPIFYISLKLNYISIQGITWILKSIQRDFMTPTEKLIYSRIKECFGYKITQNEWQNIIMYLQSIQKIDKSINFNHIEIPDLVLQKTKDLMNNSEFFLIFFQDQEWIIHDQGPLRQEDYENWCIFLEFISDFFREDKKELWITSVMNIHSYDPKKSIVKPPKSVTRAIPGGRYGCAQMLKQCGPNQLRALCLGKLSMFVQEAITDGLLIYYKTLLIKGNIDSGYKKKIEIQGDEKIQRINWVKTLIIDILKENKQGVSLARLPKLIQRRVNFNFDIQDLGFLKLKNLLKTIDGVWIENDGTTYAYAFFNQTNFNINTFLNNIRVQIKSIVEKNITGITGEQLFYELTVKLGHGLDIKAFNSDNFSDFLQKFASDICIVKLINNDDKFHYMVYPLENNTFNIMKLFDFKSQQQQQQQLPQQQQLQLQQNQNHTQVQSIVQNPQIFQSQQQQQINQFSNYYEENKNNVQNKQIIFQNNAQNMNQDETNLHNSLKFIDDLLNEDDLNMNRENSNCKNIQKQQSAFHQDLNIEQCVQHDMIMQFSEIDIGTNNQSQQH